MNESAIHKMFESRGFDIRRVGINSEHWYKPIRDDYYLTVDQSGYLPDTYHGITLTLFENANPSPLRTFTGTLPDVLAMIGDIEELDLANKLSK